MGAMDTKALSYERRFFSFSFLFFSPISITDFRVNRNKKVHHALITPGFALYPPHVGTLFFHKCKMEKGIHEF